MDELHGRKCVRTPVIIRYVTDNLHGKGWVGRSSPYAVMARMRRLEEF